MQEPHSVGVLGVFSHESYRHRRVAARLSWMAPAVVRAAAAGGINCCFVMRRQGAAEHTELEALEFGDVCFVNASARASRTVGPLLTLKLWWQLALQRWPHAKLIGKADDDGALAMKELATKSLP